VTHGSWGGPPVANGCKRIQAHRHMGGKMGK